MSRTASKRSLVPALAIAALCLETPAMADQRDPRLDPLFDSLASASTRAQASRVERLIWEIWFEAGDEAVNRRLREGVEALDRGDAGAALAAFDDVIAARPDFAEGWNRRATLYFLLRRFQESVADIERTLALEPRHFGALSGLALIRAAQNEPFAALEALERVSRIHPRMPHLLERVEELSADLGEAI